MERTLNAFALGALAFVSVALAAGRSSFASELDVSDLQLSFSQTFEKMPPLRSGPVTQSAPKQLDDPTFLWTAAYKFARPSPRAAASTAFKQPAIAWHPGEGAVYPNADAINASGWSPFSIRNAKLVIAANRMPESLLPYIPDGFSRDYASGALISYPYSQQYGYFEARMKLAKGRGLWPAFWLMPADGSWPPENDVMENLGHETRSYYVSIHQKVDGKHVFAGKRISTPDLSADFHLYGVDWGPDRVRYYFDRKLVHEAPTPPDWRQPFYMLVNLGVGGPKSWPGAPDAATKFPAEIEIDYIKAWRRKSYESGAHANAGAERAK